jgi:hypothetical protein
VCPNTPDAEDHDPHHDKGILCPPAHAQERVEPAATDMLQSSGEALIREAVAAAMKQDARAESSHPALVDRLAVSSKGSKPLAFVKRPPVEELLRLNCMLMVRGLARRGRKRSFCGVHAIACIRQRCFVSKQELEMMGGMTLLPSRFAGAQDRDDCGALRHATATSKSALHALPHIHLQFPVPKAESAIAAIADPALACAPDHVGCDADISF